MKRFFALVLALLLLMSVAAPYLAIAETSTDPPDTPAETVAVEPAEPTVLPVVTYTTGADPPRAVIDLTDLLQAVLSFCLSLITAFLIPWIKAKYSTEQRQRIAAIYQTVVYAAEQLYGAGAGDQKLKWATEQLEAKGFTVDRATLEAEVKKMQGIGYAILDSPVEGGTVSP